MITALAFILLILRLVATYLLVGVIKSQRELMKRPIDEEIKGFRRDLHWLTIALMLSNIPAIILDVFFIFKGVGWAWTVASNEPILIFYTISNAVSAMLAAVLISKIYRDALRVDQTHPTSDHTLMNDE